jgi:deoxyhypusine synthase
MRTMPSSPVRDFVRHHFRHFNAAALVRAAEDYEKLLAAAAR